MTQTAAATARQPTTQAKPIMRRLTRLLLRFRWLLAAVVTLRLAGMGMELLAALIIRNGFNRIDTLGDIVDIIDVGFWQAFRDPPNALLAEIRTLAAIIIVVAVVGGVFGFATRIEQTRLSQRVVRRLRSRLYSTLQKLSFGYYDRNVSGQIINRVTGDVRNVQRFLTNSLLYVFECILRLVGYGAMMIYINWKLTVLSLLPTPFVVLVMIYMGRRLRPAFRVTREAEDGMITVLQENIAGVRVVKAFGRQHYEIERFGFANQDVYGKTVRVASLFAFFIPTIRLIASFSLILMFAYAAWSMIEGELKVGDLVFFAAALGMIVESVRGLAQTSNIYQEAMASGERVFEILDARSEVEERAHARPLPDGRGEVVFNHATFGYDPHSPVLHDIDFAVAPGEVMAVVGPTGSGKTTLVNLLPRFYDPQEGRVLIDGTDLTDLRLADLREQIGLVFQETFLFSDTVANNIAYGANAATMEQIVHAAEIARAAEFIEELDEGYDTVIGERGVSLSGGQRQRLAIARAIVTNPRILILDDALASVDPTTEQEIVSGLGGVFAGRTVFVIAHRLSAVMQADRIVVLDNGRITQIGIHRELMQTDGYYRTMARLQLMQDGHPEAV